MRHRGSRSVGQQARRFRRRLLLELLEVRQMLSAGVVTAPTALDWFESCLASNEPRHVNQPAMSVRDALSSTTTQSVSGQSNVYDWIVHFDTASLGGISSVGQTSSLLDGDGIDFEIVRGLGQSGEVLARSHGASTNRVAAALRANQNVDSYEIDSVQQVQALPNDSQFSDLWALHNSGQSGGTVGADIDAANAWNISTGSRNVVVAVLDTGVDYTHADLAANIWTNSTDVAGNALDDDNNGFVNDVHGYNFYDDTGDAMDDSGHGTHVAGILGASGNNGQGVTGVNWSVSIMSLKFLGADGSGYTSDAVRAINYATMMRTQYGVNIRVINASWGGGGFNQALSDAIQAAGAAGILVVAAAGNTPTNNDTAPQYPANYCLSNVISVAATDRTDHLASFSSYGASTVQLAAPGVGIYSTYPGNSYTYLSGTSMATPEVAGVAALAWSVAPNATVAQIRSAILQGVDQLPSLAGKVSTGGRLNAYNTLRLLTQGQSSTPVIASLIVNPNAVAAGGTVALAAQGVSEPGGAITGVYFYQDSNGNDQWDAADRQIGSTGSIVAGQASVAMDTTGMNAGTYRLFARALDSQNRWSASASTQLTVLSPDTRGHNFATAMLTTVGSTLQGTIKNSNDADFYKFQVVAGTRYVFQTTLGSLYDSVLNLMGHDGQTVLAQNDDIGSGNYASRITWQAPDSGTYYLAVATYPASGIGTYTLQLSAQTGPLVMSSIGNQNIQQGASLSVPIAAYDPAGNRLTFSATAKAVDAVAQAAYDLDQRLGLSSTTQWRNNARGWRERYFVGTGGSVYFIVPNGTLYQLVNSRSIGQSVVMGQLTKTYYASPRLLYNATQPALKPLSAKTVAVSTAGGVLTIHPSASFAGNIQMVVSASNGKTTVTQSFTVTVANSSNGSRACGMQTPPADASPAAATLPLATARSVDQAVSSGSWGNQLSAELLLDLRALNAIFQNWRQSHDQ